MRKTSLAALKKRLVQTKSDLEREGDSVNITALLHTVDLPRTTFNYLLTYVVPQWRAELHIVDGRQENYNKTLIYGLYEFAASLLLKEDHLPTAKNLSEMLNVSLCAIYYYMNRHKDLAEKIGFSSEIEDRAYHAGRKIRFRGERVTRIAIACEAGLSYTTVKVVLQRRPEFIAALAVQRASNTGKDNVERTIRERSTGKIVAAGPPRPSWLKLARPLPRVPLSKTMDLKDRIIDTVCQRYRIEREHILARRPRGSRAGRLASVQRLTMHLLLEDAALAVEEVGALFSFTRPGHVLRNRAKFLADFKRSCVQKELKVLRNRYLKP